MMDYSQILDAEIREFIAHCDQFYPPDAIDLSITEQRAVYDRLCAAFEVPYPAGIRAQECSFGGIDCRLYTPRERAADAYVLFCHGGGFVVGGLHSHDSFCAEIAASTGLRVLAVDYLLSPEHRFPADFNSAWSAFAGLCAASDAPIIGCGDSAGGNLIAAMAHFSRGKSQHSRMSGQVLIYPGLGGAPGLPSMDKHANAPGLSAADVVYYFGLRTDGRADFAQDPRCAPLRDTDFMRLPQTVVFSAQCDPLASEGERYVQLIQEAGGQADWIYETGLIHGYIRARHTSEKARLSMTRITSCLSGMV